MRSQPRVSSGCNVLGAPELDHSDTFSRRLCHSFFIQHVFILALGAVRIDWRVYPFQVRKKIKAQKGQVSLLKSHSLYVSEKQVPSLIRASAPVALHDNRAEAPLPPIY